MKRLLLICIIATISATTNITYADNSAVTKSSYIAESGAVNPQRTELIESEKLKYDNFCKKASDLIDKKQYSQAEACIDNALNISNDLDMAHALKARLYFMQKKYDVAQKELEKALSINDNNDVANNIAGNLLVQDNKCSDALKYYQKALQTDPNSVKYLFNIANVYGGMSEYDTAIEYCTKSISNATNADLKEYSLFLRRAKLYNIVGKYDLALKDIDSAIKLDSKNYMAYSLKGKILANLGDYKNATTCVNKGIKLAKDNQNAELYLNKIYVYQKFDCHYIIVAEDFKAAEKYAKDNVFFLHQIAQAYDNYSEYNNACDIYKKILEIDPNNHAAIFNYARVLNEMQNYSLALNILESNEGKISEQINRDGEYRKAFYSNLGIAKYGIARLNNYELIRDAIEDLKKINNCDKSYWIANGYFINGDYKNAYNYYKNSIRLNNQADFNTVYKILLLSQLATYNNYDAQKRVWGLPNWIEGDFDWDDILSQIGNDVIARVNYSNAVSRIDDKNYILTTIQMLKSKSYGVGKVYNLHIDDENFGNTSRIIVYPYINANDSIATTIDNDDYNLIIANQYFILLKNSLMSIPKVYFVNEIDISNFFNSIEKIPSKIAANYIVDLTALSLAQWDIFDNEGISLSFYNSMISYLKSKNLDKSSNKTKNRIKSAYLGMGDYYLEKKGIDEATYYYNCAIPYGASKFDINEFIGNYYFGKEDYFKAIDYFSKALSAKNDAEVYLKRGYSKSKLKDYDGAVADYNKAIIYNKNLKLAYWERAQILFEQRKYSVAFNDYVKYSTFDKNDAGAQYNAGICLYNIGKKQAALPYLNKAKSLAQSSGNTELYNKSINVINEIKGYGRRY